MRKVLAPLLLMVTVLLSERVKTRRVVVILFYAFPFPFAIPTSLFRLATSDDQNSIE